MHQSCRLHFLAQTQQTFFVDVVARTSASTAALDAMYGVKSTCECSSIVRLMHDATEEVNTIAPPPRLCICNIGQRVLQAITTHTYKARTFGTLSRCVCMP
jgi:hypothetical protein